jgi:hypothetical protein
MYPFKVCLIQMNKRTIMITIILLFAVAAVFGLTLLVPVLQGQSPKRAFVFIHGGIAATALVLLVLEFMKAGNTVPQISVILFVAAALGGLILVTRDLQKKPIPKGLALIHASAAVIAFLILLFAVL